MSDLVKRLRDEEERHFNRTNFYAAGLFTEAADALEAVERECHARNCIGLSEEVTELKDKLAIAVEALMAARLDLASNMLYSDADKISEALARISDEPAKP